MTTQTRAKDSTATSPEVIQRLCTDSATALDLFSQLKQAHWNVQGPAFIALHELFDEQAAATRQHMDTLAERLRILGGIPRGTVRQAAELSELPDFPEGIVSVDEAVRTLADRHEHFSNRLKESARLAAEAGDVATEDICIEVMRSVDLQAWFLRSHLV